MTDDGWVFRSGSPVCWALHTVVGAGGAGRGGATTADVRTLTDSHFGLKVRVPLQTDCASATCTVWGAGNEAQQRIIRLIGVKIKL